MLHDNFVFLDGAYRMTLGYIPHTDFHTAIGFLNFALPALALLLTNNIGAAMPTASAMIVILFTPIAIYIISTRLRYWIAIPFYLYIILLMSTPFLVGGTPTEITYAMIYNRVSWALLSLLIIFYLPAFARKPAFDVIDGIACSVIIIFLIYMKVTYGLVALSIAALIMILSPSRWRSAAIAIAFLLIFVGAVEIFFGLSYNYFVDVKTIIQNRPALARGWGNAFVSGVKNVHYILPVIAAVFLLCLNHANQIKISIFFGCIIVASILLFSTNSQESGLPTCIALVAVAADQIFRYNLQQNDQKNLILTFSIFLIFVIAVARPLTFSISAFTLNYIKSKSAVVSATTVDNTDIPYFVVEDWPRGGWAQKMRLASEAVGAHNYDTLRKYVISRQPLFQSEYFDIIKGGLKILNTYFTDKDRVIVFDFANPYSFLLGWSPPTGDQTTHTYGIDTKEKVAIPADQLLHDTTVVMVPKTAIEPYARDGMLQFYGEYLRENFELVHQDQYWDVWKRKMGNNPAADS